VNNKMTAETINEIKKRHSVHLNKHYTALQGDELMEVNIVGNRLSIAKLLNSKSWDISMIVLIILYTFIVFVLLSFDDSFYDDNPDMEILFQTIDIIILFIFCADIGARIYAFRMLYLRDYLNIIDIAIIVIAIIFWILDICIDDTYASTIFRLRGLFRLVRVVLLVRKYDQLKVSRKAKMKSEISFSDFKSPLEQTLEIMTTLRECLEDQKFVRDLNYCIKHISNGRLYDLEVKDSEQEGLTVLRRSRRGGILAMEENLWIRSCSSASNPRSVSRLSRMSSAIITNNRSNSTLQQKMSISDKAKKMFENVASIDFNIFDYKEEVKNQELV
jgi:hypothetical protein